MNFKAKRTGPRSGAGILSGNGTQPGSGPAFRGPTRRGVEYLGLGANWAVFNQARDDTKPTWILRFETRLSVADDMRFDPAAPTKNTAVGPGYHQFIFSTLFARRFGPLEPYSGAWVVLPVLTQNSPFSAPGLSGGAQKRLGFGNRHEESDIVAGQAGWAPRGLRAAGQAELRFDGLDPLCGRRCPVIRAAAPTIRPPAGPAWTRTAMALPSDSWSKVKRKLWVPFLAPPIAPWSPFQSRTLGTQQVEAGSALTRTR